MVFANLTCDDLPGGDIFNRCQVPHRSVILNPTQITAPHLVRLCDGQVFCYVILIGMMRHGNRGIALCASPWWAQIVFRHDALRPFVIDTQLQRHTAMTIRRMLAMKRFDLLFEGLIFGRQPQVAIDVLAINP